MELVKYNNNSISSVTALGGISSGGLNLITTNTISSGVSSSSFTSNINSTYDTYLFKWINCHPASSSDFSFNLSIDGGSNYNVAKSSANMRGYHRENGTQSSLTYDSGKDLAQGTGYQPIGTSCGVDNDEGACGHLFLFSPSSDTFVKHYLAVTTNTESISGVGNFYYNYYHGGYGNTSSAINAVDFKFASGNIDSGVIKMYGLSKS